MWGWWGKPRALNNETPLGKDPPGQVLADYGKTRRKQHKESDLERNSMKEVTTLTVRQDRDEPRLMMRIYRDNPNFYIRIESDNPAIPSSLPMRIRSTNFKDAKGEAEKLLRLIRGVFRQALRKAPNLPDYMKEADAEVPTFLDFLLTKSSPGEN